MVCIGMVRLERIFWWLSVLAIWFTFLFHVFFVVWDVMLLRSFHCVCFVLRCVRYELLGARIVSVRRFSWGCELLYTSASMTDGRWQRSGGARCSISLLLGSCLHFLNGDN